MIKTSFSSILIILVFFFAFECTNQDGQKGQVALDFDSLKTEFLQNFVANSLSDTLIQGVKGTKILIPKNIFCFQNGEVVKSAVNIELIEFYTLSDMFLSKLSTISNSKNLETAGMIYLRATIEGKELSIVEGNEISIEFNTKYNPSMEIFYGNRDNIGNMNWINQKDNKDSLKISFSDSIPYSENNHLHNVLKTIKLGWINCDKFLDFSSTTEIFAQIETGIDSSVFCGLVLKKYNSIVPGVITSKGNYKFYPIPENEEVIFMSISFKDERYYIGIQNHFAKTNEIYKLSMQEVTLDELKKKLNDFDKSKPLL